MIAALQCVRKQGPAKLVAAAPVSPLDSFERVVTFADEVICLLTRDTHCFAVADFYGDFHDMSDGEVRKYLRETLKWERTME